MPYFQDEWKVTPTFTLTAGIRWDYYGVANEATNRTTVFDFNEFHGVCLGSGSFNVAPSPGPINTAPCPKNPALYNPSYRNFDPRIALAWAPSALHGKTVFRAGFGIYHGAAQNDDLNAGLESDTFRVLSHRRSGNYSLSSAYEQRIPTLRDSRALRKPAQHPRALQRQGRRDLYAEKWGLTVEHELPANFMASAQYLGSRGVRLFSRGAVNLCTTPVTINPGNIYDADCVPPVGPVLSRAEIPFGSVDYKSDIGSSTYHGLSLSLDRRFKPAVCLSSRATPGPTPSTTVRSAAVSRTDRRM